MARGWFVVNEDKLSVLLSEFARTLTTDFPISGILDYLVKRIVDVIPVSSAGVTLISDTKAPRFVAASDSSALRFERLQSELGEGPCLAAYETGEAVMIDDLRAEGRFPRFVPAAAEAGLAAVFTIPLRHDGGCLGALDLYRDTPGLLDAADMSAAQTLADVAAAYLLNAQARDDLRMASDLFRHRAMHDPLTGLPNRALLKERLERAADRAKGANTVTAVLFVDLDHFKSVNDLHGHQVGDALLFAVGARLCRLIRAGDTLARFSGDEFVLLCEDIEDIADVEALAIRISAGFDDPFVLSGLELRLSASVGVAVAAAGEVISDELIARADTAMYQVKRSEGDARVDARRRHLFDPTDTLTADLRAALDAHEFHLAYQPVIRHADMNATGVEALLRWTHPRRGPVPPLTIVAVAEQSGMISDIGLWVLENACRDRAAWQTRHPDLVLDLMVNVSASQLRSPGFCKCVRAVLERTGVDASTVVLELTEGVVIDDSEQTIQVLEELNAAGIRLALDDFGSGYSSLNYLGRLPIHIVKIDRSFVVDIDQPATVSIVAAVIDLARVLGLTVIAEGVETSGQDEALRKLGCEYSQGYFHARPMPATAVFDLLDRARISSN